MEPPPHLYNSYLSYLFTSCTIFGSRKEKLGNFPNQVAVSYIYIIWRHSWWLLVICGSPPDHHLLLSWPDWCKSQVHLLLEKKSLKIWMCFSPRMYSDGSVTKKGWSINWVAIPDWSTHATDKFLWILPADPSISLAPIFWLIQIV